MSETSQSVVTEPVASSGESVTKSTVTGAGLVIAGPLSLLTSTAQLSTEPQLTSTCPSLSTSCVLVASTRIPPSSVSKTSYTGTPARLSDAVEQAEERAVAAVSETVCSVTQTPVEHSHLTDKMSLQQVREASLIENTDKVMGVGTAQGNSGLAEAGVAVNANKAVIMDEPEVQQTLSKQQEEETESTAEVLTVGKDDSCTGQASSPPLEQDDMTGVTGEAAVSSVVTTTHSDSSDITGSSKFPVALASSGLKSDTATCETAETLSLRNDNVDDERMKQADATASSRSKDDDNDKGAERRDTTATGDGSLESTGTEAADETVSHKNDESQSGPATAAAETVSHDKDDTTDGKHAEETESTLKEKQSRQVMTLPAALLSQVNPSLPISLSVSHHQIVVPAANIYQSTSGLRLMLPPDSLPTEYVGSKQLACTLRCSDDMAHSQLISISLTLH